jgi:hypothetical protein
MEKKLYILVHPYLSLGTIKREVEFISEMGHDIVLVNYGEVNGPLDAYMLQRPMNVVSGHVVAKDSIPIPSKGRGIIIHGEVSHENLESYITGFLKDYHAGYSEVLYMHDVEPETKSLKTKSLKTKSLKTKSLKTKSLKTKSLKTKSLKTKSSKKTMIII